MVELVDVSYAAGGRPILHGVSLAFARAQLTAVLGPNGAGKSTMLRIAAGLIRGWRGAVRYTGRPIAEIGTRSLARMRAVLGQHAEPGFPLSAEEVVEMGRYPHFERVPARRDREAVERALETVGMTDRRRQRFATLSAGERQKIQMARVLAQMDSEDREDDRVLFLDEPTASLDVHHQLALLEIARGLLARGITVIAVLHDLNLAGAYADRHVLLDGGHVVHSGSRAEGLPEHLVERVYRVRAHRVTVAGLWQFELPRGTR
jgi:iron complex transport system ATP-binding protein